ncbi:CAP domain-containing protein [Streptomyces sp. NPDC088785]|uniref:CAP domain-containing protein n=1 Tax=Streptomyces sp. NPDC088785 TaxID=3365897 RepID=UPI00381F2EC0
MKRSTMAGVLATAAASVALLAGTAGTAAAGAPEPGAAYHPDVDWITCQVNQERAAHGLPGLRLSDRASEVAGAHARDMAGRGRLSTVGSDGRDLRTRLTDAGLFSAHAEEFMYSGYRNDAYFADTVTDPDPGNDIYASLMSREVTAVGIGYDRAYWDVDLLGPHRKLVTRAAVCAAAP